MDQQDEEAGGEQGAELGDEALAWLELVFEEANGCFPCAGGGQSPEMEMRAERAPVMSARGQDE